MKSTPRSFSKKEWRKHIDKCWEVQETLKKCVTGSRDYSKFSDSSQYIIDKAISKGFIYEYLNFYSDDNNQFSPEVQFFYNKNSFFWKKNEDKLQRLEEKCNLFSLFDCAEGTYNLENMEGSYEYAKRYFK